MIKTTFLILTLSAFGSLLGSMYLNIAEEKRNSRWKLYVFAFASFLSAYFEYATQEMTFAYALKELSLSIVIIFGCIASFLAMFLNGEKKIYGIISAGMTIPFSMICLFLSCIGVVHWMMPVIYFAIPTIIFAALVACDTLKEKVIMHKNDIQVE